MPLQKSIERRFRRTLRDLGNTWNGWFGPEPHPRTWLFIVGCFNSGTTLLDRVLGEQPEIGTMPFEGQACTNQLVRPQMVGLSRLWVMDPQQFRMTEADNHVDVPRLKREWGARFNDPTRPVLVEKTPTNVLRMRWLKANFEGARFLGVIRDGYAVAEGIHRKTGHPLGLAARQWRVCNEVMLSEFKEIGPSMVVRYEEFTEAPEETLAQVLSFVGSKNVVKLDREAWRVHEQTEPIKNMNHKSFERLSESELNEIEGEAGPLLEELGYLRARR